MSFLDEFGEIVKHQEPLAPYTALRLGGPAQALAQPRSVEELARLVRSCRQANTSYHILGAGCNLLVRDEGVRGVVIRLNEPAFTGIEVTGSQVRAGAGASVSALISESSRQALAGLEPLVGIPGTLGGALRTNAGSRSGFIGQHVRQVEAMDGQGQVQRHEREELPFDDTGGSDDLLILSVTFELEKDDPDSILKRLRKFWIHKKAHQPLSFQAAGRLFKDPRGLAADQLIEQAGLQGTRVGGAEVSDRQANYVVVHPGATTRDVLRLIELLRARVAERFGQMLELALVVW